MHSLSAFAMTESSIVVRSEDLIRVRRIEIYYILESSMGVVNITPETLLKNPDARIKIAYPLSYKLVRSFYNAEKKDDIQVCESKYDVRWGIIIYGDNDGILYSVFLDKLGKGGYSQGKPFVCKSSALKKWFNDFTSGIALGLE